MAAYATVDQLYAEGVSTDVTEGKLLERIRRASDLIENYTHRWFYPRECTITLDGSGSSILQLSMPIIAITRVRFLSTDRLGVAGTQEISLDELRAYNRHLSENLTDPDDRNNPRIQFLYATRAYNRPLYPTGVFPNGVRNIEVTGLFGYTDWDAGQTFWTDGVTPVGKTPDLIRDVCMALVARDLAPIADLETRAEAAASGNVLQMRTRDQMIVYGGNKFVSYASGIAGNRELAAMLAPYCRLGTLGAV